MSNGSENWYAGFGTLLSLAGALLLAVGVGTGVATPMLVSHPGLVVLFAGLVLVGALGASLSAIKQWIMSIRGRRERPPDKSERNAASGPSRESGWDVSIAAFIVGVLGLVWLAGWTMGTERPHITASLEATGSGLAKVTTTVTADGVNGDEFVFVRSEGTLRVPIDVRTGESSLADTAPRTVLVHEAVIGPSTAGSINASSTFEVSTALFEDIAITAWRSGGTEEAQPVCIPASAGGGSVRGQGCVRFRIPRPPIRPVAVASVTPSSGMSSRTLEATVSAEGVPYPSTIVVRAWVGHTGRPFVDQAIGPDVAGNVKSSFKVPMPAGLADACVCLVAALVPSREHPSRKDVTGALCDHVTDLPGTVGAVVIRGS